MNKKKLLISLFVCLIMQTPLLSHAKIPESISSQFAPANITADRIFIRAPAIAENGAVVGIEIQGIKDLPANVHVEQIDIFTPFRQEPIASFRLNKSLLPKGLKTRIKMQRSGWVYAVAKLSNGDVISGQHYIKVTIGGCGGGGTGLNSGGKTYHHQAPPVSYYTPHRVVPAPVRGREKYASVAANGVVKTTSQPVSTFSIDVDTGSYANTRRFLIAQGRLPVANAVRVEEMINYFSYDYPQPENRTQPFNIVTEMGPTPWNADTHLLHIGLKGYDIKTESLPPSNLVFLIDVSGSMGAPGKLSLLIPAMKMLVNKMRPQDRIAIVVYAGGSGVVLDSTSGAEKSIIMHALEQLRAGGSTNGAAGIQLAYEIARDNFVQEGINRVILATDGDFNVGMTSHDALIKLIEKQRDSGISLTTLGFGTGNYNDHLMEQLADHGNGNYAYIDSLREAQKVLSKQASSTLFTIAKDVKIQVEFNPSVVAEYRLIGYENRVLQEEDFRNDKVDAGDIGAGHSVTALYEVTFVDSHARRLEPSRYGIERVAQRHANEIAEIRLRYKLPKASKSRLIRRHISRADIQLAMDETSNNFRFAAAVAAFGQNLRGGKYTEQFDYTRIHQLAMQGQGSDPDGHRREFLDMVKMVNDIL